MKTKSFIKRIIAVSGLTLTAHSWGHTIFPPPFDGLKVQHVGSGKYVRYAATEKYAAEDAGVVNEDKSTSTNISYSPSNASVSGVVNSNGATHPGYGYTFWDKQHQNLIVGHYGSLFGAGHDEVNDSLFEEVKSWVSYKDNSELAINFNLRDALPYGSGNSSGQNGSGQEVGGKGLTGSENSAVPTSNSNGNQVKVSEPSSVALICSGVLGLMLTRRYGKQKQISA